MTAFNQYPMENNGINDETQPRPPKALFATKYRYSAGILKSLAKEVEMLSEKDLNRAIQELLPGPAERSLMRN